MGALDAIRVIDFGQYLAGPLLGQLLADVIVQNFRSDVVKRPGIDYESVARRKPDII